MMTSSSQNREKFSFLLLLLLLEVWWRHHSSWFHCDDVIEFHCDDVIPFYWTIRKSFAVVCEKQKQEQPAFFFFFFCFVMMMSSLSLNPPFPPLRCGVFREKTSYVLWVAIRISLPQWTSTKSASFPLPKMHLSSMSTHTKLRIASKIILKIEQKGKRRIVSLVLVTFHCFFLLYF